MPMINLALNQLFEAVETDSLDVLGGILTLDDSDIDINGMIDGETALMKAARLGSASIARALLNRRPGLLNADITILSDMRTRKTAAQMAESEGFISLKTAIQSNRPEDWKIAIPECNQRKEEMDRALSNLRP